MNRPYRSSSASFIRKKKLPEGSFFDQLKKDEFFVLSKA